MAKLIHSFTINQRLGDLEDFTNYASNVMLMFDGMTGLERVGPDPIPFEDLTQVPQSTGIVVVGYRLIDTFADTAPLYFQLTFYDPQTSASRSSTGIAMRVFTGLDAQGQPTGMVRDWTNFVAMNRMENSHDYLEYPSYLCVTEGFVGFHFGLGRYGGWHGGFTLRRFHDDQGYPTF